jgi:hypothetical protein
VLSSIFPDKPGQLVGTREDMPSQTFIRLSRWYKPRENRKRNRRSLRSGRDDNSVACKWPQSGQANWMLMVPQNCHPDRSVAERRDLRFLFRFSRRLLRSRPMAALLTPRDPFDKQPHKPIPV